MLDRSYKKANFDIPRILIGIPSTGVIHAETVSALFGAMVNLSDCQTMLVTPTGCYIHQLREFICMMALEERASHVMFIDSDMIFTPDSIRKLLNHNKEIIGGDYHYKMSDKVSVTKLDPKKIDLEFIEEKNGEKRFATKRPDYPVVVDAVGTGFMLIKTEALKKIPKPWFWYELKNGQMIGEDVYFCRHAAKHGVEVWCDPTLQIGHIGNYIY